MDEPRSSGRQSVSNKTRESGKLSKSITPLTTRWSRGVAAYPRTAAITNQPVTTNHPRPTALVRCAIIVAPTASPNSSNMANARSAREEIKVFTGYHPTGAERILSKTTSLFVACCTSYFTVTGMKQHSELPIPLNKSCSFESPLSRSIQPAEPQRFPP